MQITRPFCLLRLVRKPVEGFLVCHQDVDLPSVLSLSKGQPKGGHQLAPRRSCGIARLQRHTRAIDGFSLHAAVRCDADDRQPLEQRSSCARW